jgi:putative ABC transport system substrate-binding protein
VRDAAEITQRIAAFARDPNGALVALPSSVTIQHRVSIIGAATQQGLPTMYPYRYFTIDGGLMSYGVRTRDLFRGGVSYVDQILKGAKVAELPVQAPTKYELIVNLKTAKALGLSIPASLLGRADEVIE